MVQDCIVIGAKQMAKVLNTKIMYYHLCTNDNLNQMDIDQIMETLVCSNADLQSHVHYGAMIDHYKLELSKFRTFDKIAMIIDYNNLRTKKYLESDENSYEYNRVIDLKHRLGIKMDQLVETSCGGKERKMEIDSVLCRIPICCTDIIFGYQIIEPKFDIIDWSKY